MKNYTNDISLKPKLKKCKDCGSFGNPNPRCKYWSYDVLTEWACSNPKVKKKIKFYAKIKNYWICTPTSDYYELKAKTQEKAQKEAEKKVKKLNAHNLGIYTLEDVFSEVEE